MMAFKIPIGLYDHVFYKFPALWRSIPPLWPGTTDLRRRLPPARPRRGPGTAEHMFNLGRGHVQAATAGPGGDHHLPAAGSAGSHIQEMAL